MTRALVSLQQFSRSITRALVLSAVCWMRLAAQSNDSVSLILNLPAFRLDVYASGTRVSSYPVAIGSPRYPTPVGTFALSAVTWNPWWIPPNSGWAANEKPTPPGPRNPLGLVKMTFRPLYAIHGTADTNSIGRAASHGCVRLANAHAVALADYLIASDARPEGITTRPTSPDETRTVALARLIPLRIEYELVEVRDSALEAHPDPYRRRKTSYRALALLALSRAGFEAAAIDSARVATLLARAGRVHVSIPLHEIVRGQASRPSIPVIASDAGPLAPVTCENLSGIR